MQDDRRNDWTRHTRHDTLFNGALLAVGIVGLILATMGGPSMPEVSGLVLSEAVAA